MFMKLRWPFGGQNEVKSAGPMLALSEMGAPRWGGRTGAQLTRDGYLRNAVAYRCVRMVAEAAASVPLVCGEARAAKLLARPQPELTGAALLEALYTQLQLSGQAFVEAATLAGDETPSALFTLKPDAMRVVTDARGWVSGWAVRERHNERSIGRDADGWCPVLQLKTYNPVDDVYGLPPLGAARRALDLHNASADWAKALIDNSAKPSGALVYGGEGSFTDEQFDKLKEELSAQYGGSANAGRPLLLDGGLDWKPMSLSPAEMDFQDARNAAAREIALALGVPPMLLGIPGDNTYANYKEANLAFWRMTVLPLAQRTGEALGLWLSARFGDDVTISCDLDRVPALSAERDALWARLNAASFATNTEKRRLAGLET
jgi:HK97 family phage portal protein